MKKLGKNGLQILVVDDEATVCQAIKMLLEFDGHKVETTDDAEAALAILETKTFDLIITDYSMNGMKGDRMAAHIRKTRPQQPIIMVTAFADDFRSGGKPTVEVDAVVSKPFSLKELREVIGQVLACPRA